MESRSLVLKDSKDLAMLHFKAFQNFFLTSLGIRFLEQFYASILKTSKGFGVGFFDNGRLIGFSVGTLEVRGFYKQIALESFLVLSISSLPYIFYPKTLLRLIKSLSSNNEGIVGPCLLSICVSPDSENKGVGRLLISEFETILNLKGVSEYYLTTDANNNNKANAFYMKNNFHLSSQLVGQERRLNVYYKKL